MVKITAEEAKKRYRESAREPTKEEWNEMLYPEEKNEKEDVEEYNESLEK